MAQLNAAIDTGAQKEREHKGSELIPNNTWLLFDVIEADVAQSTKEKGDWEGVKYTVKVVGDIPENEGFYGRQVWGVITTSHTCSEQGFQDAVASGLAELGEFGRALGLATVGDSDQLLGNEPFWGRVGIKYPSKKELARSEAAGNPPLDPKNVIREYRAYGDKRPRGKAPVAARQPVQQAAPAARPAATRPAAPASTSWRDRQKSGAQAAAASTAVHEPLDDAMSRSFGDAIPF